MVNWLTEHLTLPYLLVFIIGLLLGYGINWWVCRRKAKKDPANAKEPKRDGFITIVGFIIIITMVWIMVSVDQARNCAIRLNTSLQVEITAGKMEREAFQNAIAQQQLLPVDVRDLPENDPVKRAAMKPIEDYYFSETLKAKKIREENAAAAESARKACGT